MSVVKRTGVLLRLAPELLSRVDRARGSMSRTQWLTLAVQSYLTHWDATGERPSLSEHTNFMDRSETPTDSPVAQGLPSPLTPDGEAAVGREIRGESSDLRSPSRAPLSARDRCDTGEPEGLGYDALSGDSASGSPTPFPCGTPDEGF